MREIVIRNTKYATDMLQSPRMALDYQDAVHWYYSFARFDPPPSHPLTEGEGALKLARMEQILERLGNPHTQFTSILIAGTKGKGSTAALLESVLHTAGFRTGLYTSPHLHTFRERIRVNGELISQLHVVQGTTQLQTVAEHFPHSTFFEWVTALAFDYFARQRVEIAIVEVGLGGRLDCTNVLTPRVSVITPISYDHMEILGNTLAAIAREKAGIIKPEVPVVVAPQSDEAMAVIREVAAEQNAPLLDVAQVWEWEPRGATLAGQTVAVKHLFDAEPQIYELPLLGPHQRVNLVTALATLGTLKELGWRIAQSALPRGIARVEWHARVEVLAAPRSAGAGSAGVDWSDTYLIADGAHNRASAHELVRTLDEILPAVPVHFVFGVSNDKDIRGMLMELMPRASSFTFTRSRHARAVHPDELERLAAPYPVPIYTASNLAGALLQIQRVAKPGEAICVTGSLFIAAEAREYALQSRGLTAEGD